MILGIDIGNKFITLATIEKSHIGIILNETSNRRTNAIISIDPQTGKRIIGDAAYDSFVSNYKNTLTNVKYSMKYENNEFNSIPIHQTLTGFLNYCVSLAGFQSKGNIVLTVPPYFTDIQKQIYLDVGKITNLNISLYDESSALALYYGFYKCNNLAENDKKNVVFLDIGDINTTLFYVTFTNDNCEIKLVECAMIGGLYLDQKIYQHFLKEIKDVEADNIKSTIKIFKACEKIKRNLSLSDEASLLVESLYDDKDYTLKLDKSTFEKIISYDVDKLKNLLSSNISKEMLSEIDSVELLGGSSRIPIFQQVIKNFFKINPSSTLNREESVSHGAGLRAAILAPFVKMRKYNVKEYILNKGEFRYEQNDKSIVCTVNQHEQVFELDVDNKSIIIETGCKKWSVDTESNNKIYIETEYVNSMLNIKKVYTDILPSLPFKLEENKYALDDDTIKKLKDVEIKIVKQNKYLEDVAIKKNHLESIIYEWKNKFSNALSKYVKPKEINELTQFYNDTLDWMVDKNIEEIDNKLKELANKMKKYEDRKNDHENRHKLCKIFNEKLSEYVEKLDNIKNNNIKSDYLLFCDSLSEEFDTKINNNKSIIDPKFTSDDINSYIDTLCSTCDEKLIGDKGMEEEKKIEDVRSE